MFMRSGYSAHTRRVRSATEHRHRRADVVQRLGDAPRRLGPQAEGGGLGGQLVDVDAVELDDVVGDRAGPVARDDLAHALDGGAVAQVAYGDRAAGVDGAADLAQVGFGRLV